MLNYKYSSTFLASLLVFGVTIVNPEISSANTARIDQLRTNIQNQLLRVAVEPGFTEKDINIYLYTTNATPIIKERKLTKDIYAVELLDTTIATTNNINLSSVKNKVKNIKIVPFINTSNPLKTGLARIILSTTSPQPKFNIIIKPIEVKQEKENNVAAQVYYPPSKENTQPRSMAFFDPPDNRTLAHLPNEKLIAQNPDEIPEIDINDDRLTVSPRNEPPPVFEEDSVNNLPDIGTPIADPTLTPAPAEDITADTSNDTPAQGSQNPQPEPTVNQQPVSVWPVDIAGIIRWVCCPIVIILATLIIAFVLKALGIIGNKQAFDAIEEKNKDQVDEETASMEGFEPIEEPEARSRNDYSEPQPLPTNITDKLTPYQDEPIDQQQAPPLAPSGESLALDPFGEDVEEVVLIDSYDISDTKSLYLIETLGTIALMGVIGEEVIVLNKFQAHELPTGPQKMLVSKEGTIVGKEIFHVRINGWEGVIASENNHLTLHTDLSI